MSFIITGSNSGSQESAAANAFAPDEVLKSDSALKPDIDYYLHKQILPPVERLCAPITLTNITRIADCLGLDTSKYRISNAAAGQQGPVDDVMAPLDSQVPDHVRFADCNPLKMRCLAVGCGKSFTFRSMADDAHCVSHAGLKCSECGKTLSTLTVVAQLEHQIRLMLQRYYEGWLQCDDASCGNRTRQMSVYGHRCLGPKGLAVGCRGRMQWEISEKQVWNQLVYWERAFDVEKAKEKARKWREPGEAVGEGSHEKIPVLAKVNRERFGTCKGVVKGYLDKSGRQWVDMSSLFSFVR